MTDHGTSNTVMGILRFHTKLWHTEIISLTSKYINYNIHILEQNCINGDINGLEQDFGKAMIKQWSCHSLAQSHECDKIHAIQELMWWSYPRLSLSQTRKKLKQWNHSLALSHQGNEIYEYQDSGVNQDLLVIFEGWLDKWKSETHLKSKQI